MSMRTTGFALALVLTCSAPLIAQPADDPATDCDEGALGDCSTDRPLMRALAYNRRDVVEEVLLRPTSVEASSAPVLAEEVRIPLADARKIAEAARAGRPVTTLEDLIRLSLPEGARTGNLSLAKATEAGLRRAGLTEAQAREVLRFRRSAERVDLHFRELRAIHEARSRGAELSAERARRLARGSMSERVRIIARTLGLRAPAAEGRLTELRSRAEAAARRVNEATSRSGTTGRDALASFRRVDGTLDWSRLTRSELFSGANGIVHFAFALFLKELAVVLRTGDRGRLEEFVDGLLSTDFFINYGLFAAGARAADVVYGRYVRRLTRKRFLSGVLRSNLVLAAGLAIPMVARGEFDSQTYVVDVAALGLSATAVKAAVEGVKGVYHLVRGSRTLRLGRLAAPVGWVYTAAETAVVLLAGDYLANRFDRYLDERGLRHRLEEAQEALDAALDAVREGAATAREVEEAIAEFESAYNDVRRFRSQPLEERLSGFRAAMDEASREALRDDAALEALARRLESNPALARHLARDAGSAEAYVEGRREAGRRELETALRGEAERFEEDFSELLRESYEGPRDADPAPAPGSRLSTYDEETELLLRALDGTTDPEARRHIVLAIERVRLARAMDGDLYRSSAETGEREPSRGLVDGVSGAD